MGICEGRVAIVTGGGGGIGREHALLLAAQGASVVVNDIGSAPDGAGRDAAAAQQVVDEIVDRHGPGRAVADTSDVADFSGAETLVGTAVDTFGKLDVLVNNAGILRDRMLVKMTEEEWDSVIRVHLKGTFAPSHFAARHWSARSKAGEGDVAGRIINTSSPSGLYGNAKQSNYGAAKAGIAAFTVITAMELKRLGVTVNAIAPTALTRMIPRLFEMSLSEPERDALAPRHAAPIVCWLASTLSGQVTGRIFDVTGHMLSVAEGWHRGPTIERPDEDPEVLGPQILDLLEHARPNADITGFDKAAKPGK